MSLTKTKSRNDENFIEVYDCFEVYDDCCIIFSPRCSVENPVHILKEHTDIVYDCIWGRESKEGRGRLFTCGHDCKLLTWNSYDGVVIGEHVGKHEQWITGISIDHSNLKVRREVVDKKY